MRYLHAVIDHFCSRRWRRTHTHTHTHKATARLGQHVSTKLSFLSRLHQQMHTKANQNDSLEEYSHKQYCFRSSLYPKPAGSRLLQPLLLGPIAVSTQMHRQLHLLWLNGAFKVIFLHFKTSVCSNVKKCLYYYTGHQSEPTL